MGRESQVSTAIDWQLEQVTDALTKSRSDFDQRASFDARANGTSAGWVLPGVLRLRFAPANLEHGAE